LTGPANTPTKPNRLRALSSIDEPTNVTSRNTKHVGEAVHVEHDERRRRPVAVGKRASGGKRRFHGKSFKSATANHALRCTSVAVAYRESAIVTPCPCSSVGGLDEKNLGQSVGLKNSPYSSRLVCTPSRKKLAKNLRFQPAAPAPYDAVSERRNVCVHGNRSVCIVTGRHDLAPYPVTYSATAAARSNQCTPSTKHVSGHLRYFLITAALQIKPLHVI
jgi:hypothetical protein